MADEPMTWENSMAGKKMAEIKRREERVNRDLDRIVQLAPYLTRAQVWQESIRTVHVNSTVVSNFRHYLEQNAHARELPFSRAECEMHFIAFYHVQLHTRG